MVRHRRIVLATLVVIATALGAAAAFGEASDDRRAQTPVRHGFVRLRPVRPRGVLPGYLLIADRGNNRILLVDTRKRVLWRYPRPGRQLAMPFRFDDDAFFGPGFTRIISNQEDQDTIQVISFPGGRLLWRYGHPNVRGIAPGYLNTPDDAYLLPNGLRSVADAYNCRVLLISRSGKVVHQFGRTGGCVHDPPRSFGAVNGATPLPGGGFLVSEIQGSWIDRISPAGRLLWAFRAPVSYP